MLILDIDNLNKRQCEKLNLISKDLKYEYNDIVEDLSSFNKRNINWIVCSIASRNKYYSQLFLRLCYIELINWQLSKTTKSVILITSDYILYRYLKKSYNKNKTLKVKYRKNTLNIIWDLTRPIRQWLIHLFIFICRYLNRDTTQIKNYHTKDITLIDTFILNNQSGDGGSITNGKYIDRYYTNIL